MPEKPSTPTPNVTDILTTSNIPRFIASQTISQIIPHLTHSHDAVFVFDDKTDKLLGVVTPNFLFATRSATLGTKLKTCAKMPPKLDMHMSLSRAAQMMIDSKIYSLPVIDREKFAGIVTATNLLTYVINQKFFNSNGRILFAGKQLITVPSTIAASQALATMTDKKIAKLPVVDTQGNLIGIVSKYDLKDLIKDQLPLDLYDRIGTKSNRLDAPIKDYMKNMVITVDHVPSFTEAVNLMNQHRIGSLIIVDANNKPMDIITKHDLLSTIASSLSV